MPDFQIIFMSEVTALDLDWVFQLDTRLCHEDNPYKE